MVVKNKEKKVKAYGRIERSLLLFFIEALRKTKMR